VTQGDDLSWAAAFRALFPIGTSRRNLDRDEAELRRSGSRFDLTRALVGWGAREPFP
jgi:hypothetical protein